MRLVQFVRILPETTIPVYINPDYVMWLQPQGNHTIIYMESGPEIEVDYKLIDVVHKLEKES